MVRARRRGLLIRAVMFLVNESRRGYVQWNWKVGAFGLTHSRFPNAGIATRVENSDNLNGLTPFLAFFLWPPRKQSSTALLKDRSSLTQAAFLKLSTL
jgi:hypothetical protein